MVLMIGMIVLSYLLGSISFSYLFTRWLKGIDIRQQGSGNAGATNTARVLGKGPAILVLLLDACKGFAAVWMGMTFLEGIYPLLLCSAAVIVGHNWPVFLRFRGGKGIATTIGVTLTLYYPVIWIPAILAILFIILTRYVSLGSLIFVSSLPVVLLFFSTYSMPDYLFTVFIALLAIYRHKENIERLMRGEERKF